MNDAAAVDTCLAVIERLRTVVEEENAVLAKQKIVAHAPYAERKNQLLRDLMAAQRCCRDRLSLRSVANAYSGLKELLARNEALLKNHMSALEDVAAVIVDCIKRSVSDGTYSHAGRRQQTS